MAYADIDSNKVLNKEGLLELSVQIKNYVDTNIPSPYTLPTASTSTLGGVKVDGETITINDGVISAVGGGSGGITDLPIKVLYMSGTPLSGLNNLTQDSKDKLIAMFNSGDFSNYFCIIVYADSSTQRNIMYPSQRRQTASQAIINYWDLIYNKAYQFSFTLQDGMATALSVITQTYGITTNNITAGLASWDPLQKSATATVRQSFQYIKDNYATKAELPEGLPTTPTTDGNYVLKSVIADGTATNSWEVDNGGSGGATYTAGDNITISNNVISASVPMNLQVNTIQTGTGANNYFQCQKFRGEGDANTYYHAIDFGYANHDMVEFYDYGGTYIFYQNQSANKNNPTELLKITPNTITYKGQSLLGGGSTYTLPTASTSVLGGVKIDGSTITIDGNGVISAVGGSSGGGTTYTAGDNITISNNVISATVPTYTAGSNISISNGVISATGELSGTVEAGNVEYDNTNSGLNAINIQDAIDAIKNTDNAGFKYWLKMFSPRLLTRAFYQDAGFIMPYPFDDGTNQEQFLGQYLGGDAITDWATAVAQLKKYGYCKIAITSTTITKSQMEEALGITINRIMTYSEATDLNGNLVAKYIRNNETTLHSECFIVVGKGDANQWYVLQFLNNTFETWWQLHLSRSISISAPKQVLYNNYSQNTDSLENMMKKIDDSLYTIIQRIPVAPSTDGTYTLQCVVSNGTPTYSWISE